MKGGEESLILDDTWSTKLTPLDDNMCDSIAGKRLETWKGLTEYNTYPFQGVFWSFNVL